VKKALPVFRDKKNVNISVLFKELQDEGVFKEAKDLGEGLFERTTFSSYECFCVTAKHEA